MRRLVACICCGILWYSLPSQDIQGTLPGIKGLETEISGSCWVWSDQVLRVHHSDTLFFNQSFLQLGSIHSVDAYNPLKALLFFKDQGQLLWVDNRAAAISAGIQVTVFCSRIAGIQKHPARPNPNASPMTRRSTRRVGARSHMLVPSTNSTPIMR